MNVARRCMATAMVLCLFGMPTSAADAAPRLKELDAYWAEVSRAVKEGDFEAYVKTCHKEGVLVAGISKKSQPLSKALARWKKEFVDTKAGKRQSSVDFRFKQRFGDATTAHETGIFLYTWSQGDDTVHKEYIHFEALLVKHDDGWKILMEYQKAKATVQEWDAIEKRK